MMKFSNKDRQFMRRALVLAKKGFGRVSPNPMVGAVIMNGGKVIGEGYHKKFGGPHAEVEALRGISKEELIGSTLYVNLEVCAHSGKTPPCTDALINSGIKRIIVAMKDPNPKVSGRGIKALQKAGINVSTGCMEKEARKLNEKFLHWIVTGAPFVGMKIATSLDGKIGTRSGDSKFITSSRSRAYVKRLRDEYDAILVGRGTAVADDPKLAGRKSEPTRVLLDSKLSTPLSAKIFRNKNIIVVTTLRAPLARRKALEKRGIKVKAFPVKISITPLLKFLGRCGISSLFVEGGSEVFGSFVDARTINHIYWFIAPKIIGDVDAIPAVAGRGNRNMLGILKAPPQSIRRIGQDILLESQLASGRSSKR